MSKINVNGIVGIKSIKNSFLKYLSEIFQISLIGTISPSGVYAVIKFLKIEMTKIDSKNTVIMIAPL